MQTAVLFLVFNRPENAARTFDRIRAARPPRLWIHADGPRKNRMGEAEKCAATRAIFETIDWPCEVTRLFRTENWGLRKGLSDALDQFFEAEKMGIILEDDCLPEPDFFRFCEEMLEKWADTDEIMHIGGSNLLARAMEKETSASYVFTRFSFVWGWATWARAWKKMDKNLDGWPADKANFLENGWLQNRLARRYFAQKFDDVRAEKIASWAYAWFFSILKNEGKCIVSTQNLIENLGIGAEDSTNTTSKNDRAALESGSLRWPLEHPKSLEISSALELRFFFASQKSRVRLWIWTLKNWILG